ncbi:MAG: DEAD/DEAH box helicase family protein [Promethearchaeota archaeon]
MGSPLQSLNIKPYYSTDDCSNNPLCLIQDFFIPCLKNSTRYDRISAFYSSYTLAYLFQGIKEFIKNNGRMRLILGCIPKKEFNILNDKDKKKYYSEEFIQKLLDENEIEEYNLKQSVLRLFAWLLDKHFLEIKLAIVVDLRDDLKNNFEKKEKLSDVIFHEKKGIFTDKDGFKIGFIGSLNETIKGFLYHVESITTFKSWRIYPGDKYNLHLQAIIDDFQTLWNNRGKRTQVFALPDESLKFILKFLPEKFPDDDYKLIKNFFLNFNKSRGKKKNSQEEGIKKDIKNYIDSESPFKNIKWYKPQIEGYEKWIENGRSGVLAIATGVGKTLIAIRIIYEFLLENINKKKIVIILVPNNLALQWKEELDKFIFNGPNKNLAIPSLLIKLKSGLPVNTKLVLLKNCLKHYKNNLIVVYYTTFVQKVIPILKKYSNQRKILLIADEVHEIGTKKRRELLRNFNPDYRLGLSATPIRKFDDEGSHFIKEYFSGVVYQYEIHDAIKDGYLTKYNYYPLFYNLTKDELEAYRKLTQQLVIKKSKIERAKNSTERKELKLEEKNLKILRKRIIKLASNKLPILENLLIYLKKENKIYNTVIYVEDKEQLEPVREILARLDIRFDKITQDVDPNERMKIMKRFEDRQIQVIIAEKILDQGINIKSLINGIILSSTVNERQYIQRRGRLLRKYYNKDKAHIYDFLTLDENVNGEIKRAKIFYKDCDNKEYVYSEFIKYGINLKDELRDE